MATRQPLRQPLRARDTNRQYSSGSHAKGPVVTSPVAKAARRNAHPSNFSSPDQKLVVGKSRSNSNTNDKENANLNLAHNLHLARNLPRSLPSINSDTSSAYRVDPVKSSQQLQQMMMPPDNTDESSEEIIPPPRVVIATDSLATRATKKPLTIRAPAKTRPLANTRPLAKTQAPVKTRPVLAESASRTPTKRSIPRLPDAGDSSPMELVLSESDATASLEGSEEEEDEEEPDVPETLAKDGGFLEDGDNSSTDWKFKFGKQTQGGDSVSAGKKKQNSTTLLLQSKKRKGEKLRLVQEEEESGSPSPVLENVFASMKIASMRAACEEKGLDSQGNKAALLHRLDPEYSTRNEKEFSSMKIAELCDACEKRDIDTKGVALKAKLLLLLETSKAVEEEDANPSTSSLPPGWTKRVSKAHGTEYYHHASSGSQWKHPNPDHLATSESESDEDSATGATDDHLVGQEILASQEHVAPHSPLSVRSNFPADDGDDASDRTDEPTVPFKVMLDEREGAPDEYEGAPDEHEGTLEPVSQQILYFRSMTSESMAAACKNRGLKFIPSWSKKYPRKADLLELLEDWTKMQPTLGRAKKERGPPAWAVAVLKTPGITQQDQEKELQALETQRFQGTPGWALVKQRPPGTSAVNNLSESQRKKQKQQSKKRSQYDALMREQAAKTPRIHSGGGSSGTSTLLRTKLGVVPWKYKAGQQDDDVCLLQRLYVVEEQMQGIVLHTRQDRWGERAKTSGPAKTRANVYVRLDMDACLWNK